MAHTIRQSRPDPKRVAGYTFAIAFNLSLLMLLLAPMQGPQALRPGEDTPSIAWYAPKPTPPAQPPEVRITPPATQPSMAPARPAVVPQPPAAVIVEGGSEAAVAPEAVPDAQPAVEPAMAIEAPVAGVTLQYASAPPPAYPASARRMRLEGTVLLEVLVGEDGRPLRVDVREGSGHRALDEAARDQVLAHWRFRPAMRDGRAIQAIGLVPVNFRLR